MRLWSTGSLVILTLIATILTALRPVLFRIEQRPFYPAALPVFAAFLLYAGIRIPFSAVPYEAILEVLRIGALVAGFWVVANLTEVHHGRWRWILGILLMSAAVMCLYALVQHFRESRMVLNLVRPEVYGLRASGAFMCPNHFASFIGIVLPLAFALLINRDAGHTMRIFSAYAMIVILPALFLTQSRSGWMGAIAGLITVWLVLAVRKSLRKFLLALVLAPICVSAIAIAAWTFSPMVRMRVEDALRGNPRIQLWKDTRAMIREAPGLGHGAGSYRWVYPRYWHQLREFTDPEHAHNETLELVAENGLLGTTLFSMGLAVAAGSLLLRIRSVRRNRDAALIAGTAGAGIAAFIHSCFDYNFHVYGVASALALLAGVTTSALFGSGAIPHSKRAGNVFRRSVAGFLAAAAVLGILLMARSLASYLLVRRADEARLTMQGNAAETLYERAEQLDPENFKAWLGHAHLLRMRMTWSFDAEARTRDFARAEMLYRTALRHNPLLLDAEVSLALLYSASGDDERALAMLRLVVDKAPLHRDNLTRLGLQLRRMGKLEEALLVFLRAEAMGSTELIQINLKGLKAIVPGT